MPALSFFMAYVIWVLLGIGLSPLPLGSFFTLWTILLTTIAICILTISTVTTRQRMLWVMDAILVPSIFIALYGIYGYFIKKNGVVDTTTSFFRISSVFGDTPPNLALFLSIIIPMSIYRTFTLHGLKRIVGIAIVLLLLVTLGLTFTRTALLSVPVSIVVMIIFLPSRKMRIGMIGGMVAVIGLVLLAATLGNTPIFSRFFNQDITTLNGRTYLWAAVLDHFDLTQLLGRGLKASDDLLANLNVGVGRGVIATAAHNIFLETLYDHGLIGVTILILTFTSIALPLLRRVKKATPDYRMILAMAFAIFFNVIVQIQDANDFWNPSIGIYFWIIMALPFALCWTTSRNGTSAIEDVAQNNTLVPEERTEQTEQETQKQFTHV